MKHIVKLVLFALIGSGYLIGRVVTPQHQTVVFLGDSITAMWNVAAAFPNVTAINAGIGGQTTDDMLARFNSDAINHHPQSVVILAGINDLYDHPSVTEAETGLDQLARSALAANIRPYLCSLLSTTSAWYSHIAPASVSAINAWLPGEASSLGIQYVDLNSHFDPYSMSIDGLHPNATGYAQMQGVLSAFIH